MEYRSGVDSIRQHALKESKKETFDNRYNDVKAEWASLMQQCKDSGDHFDVLEIFDDMGFFDIHDEKGNRIYSDDELQDCIQEDGSVYEDKLSNLFIKEAERRSIEDDEELLHTLAKDRNIEQDNALLEEQMIQKQESDRKAYEADYKRWYESITEATPDVQTGTQQKIEILSFPVFPPSNQTGPEVGGGGGVELHENRQYKKVLRNWLDQNEILYKEYLSAHIANDPKNMRSDDYSVFLIFDKDAVDVIKKAIYVTDQHERATIVAHHLDSKAKDAWEKIARMDTNTRKSSDHGFDLEQVYWTGREDDWLRALIDVLQKNRDNESTQMVEKNEFKMRGGIDDAAREMEMACEKWRERNEGREDGDKEIFNQKWLRQNGYRSLIAWVERYTNGFSEVVIHASVDVQDAFVVKKYAKTKEAIEAQNILMMKMLEQAHKKWQEINEGREDGDIEIFNPTWILNNGFKRLYELFNQRGGFGKHVDQMPDVVRKDFQVIKFNKDRTRDSAVKELEEVYNIWKNQNHKKDQRDRDVFNQDWISKNGYGYLVAWIYTNLGGIKNIVPFTSKEFRENFKLPHEMRTVETAHHEFLEAYEGWKKEQSNPDNPQKQKFTKAWLRNNGYKGLYQWVTKHVGWNLFLDQIPENEDVKKIFSTKK